MTSPETPSPADGATVSAADFLAGGPAEVCLACDDLVPSLAFFVDVLGFRIETIFPAEAPAVATVSGHGLRLRLAPGLGGPGALRLPCRDLPPEGGRVLVAPNGTQIEWAAADPPVEIPPLASQFVLAKAGEGEPPGMGRAGMIYRDLIPGRQGGRFIASLITVPDGGPVADWVHYHKVRFQMIFCWRGWVRLVYEDQGPPFVLAAGDLVLQPPRIRHRVLESSPGLEVVELGCPALHETVADHEMSLPTGRDLPRRDFQGQLFLRHVSAATPWTADPGTGFERRDTGMIAATGGLADAGVLRPGSRRDLFVPPHAAELMFGFVLEGAALLERSSQQHPLAAADAFVIPGGEAWGLAGASPDFAFLRVRVG
jgi:quercetin dioxygenase-like cupin family protein